MSISDQNETQKFIVFQFRKLSELKKWYKVYNKELLMIVKALQKWRSYFVSTENH
jgi:hypothetical protein